MKESLRYFKVAEKSVGIPPEVYKSCLMTNNCFAPINNALLRLCNQGDHMSSF